MKAKIVVYFVVSVFAASAVAAAENEQRGFQGQSDDFFELRYSRGE